ncbi:hypothetical protein [Nodularia chucula]|uniref:hypothetical protein n=1 Tax=Nodularia chucula TaxID=3093667 RepID=UPI0039C604FD
MNQSSMVNSTTNKSGLNPALAAALASLEVPIDRELARYRRTRMGINVQKPSNAGSYLSPQTLNLPQYSPTTDTQGGLLVNQTPLENPPVTNPKLEDFNLGVDSESPNLQNPLPSSNLASSIVPTVRNQPNLSPGNQQMSPPDDYLESSEALLRSLTDEEKSTTKASSSNDSLLSPLGIGSMLLLLLASLTLGYVVFNPSSSGESGFNLGRLFFRESSPMGEENTTQVINGATGETSAQVKPLAKYPNLAVKEFPEVRNPSDIVGLRPRTEPTPTPVITPPPLVTPDVQLLPQLEPVPVDVPPSPPAEDVVNTNGEIQPSADGFYYVVMDNQGDGALSDAQKIVPDAYLSPGRTLIYLAAVRTPEAAQERVQELQSQGIKARIQQP